MAAAPRETALSALKRLLAPNQVVTDPIALMTYERDASFDRGRPDAVVFPRSAEDVVTIVAWAGEHAVPLIGRGAGTGLSGGAVAEHGGVIVAFSRMNRVLEFDRAGRSVEVEPGVVNLALDELARRAGLCFPPDPASGRTATLGGNIAENAGGPHCFKYGVTTNYITGLEVVLAGGQRLRLGGRALDIPEYDFVGLLTGSEGTLGLITRASCRLLRNTPAVVTMMAAFDSVEAAGRAVSAVIAAGLVPATMEMMDRKIMRIIEDYAHAGLPVEAGAALIIETDGYPQSVGPQMDEVAAILRAHAARGLRVAATAEERDAIWYGRKSAAGAMARLAPAYYLVDGTVPRSRLAATLAAVNRLCEAEGLQVGYVFHAGDGNLHPFILIPDPDDRRLVDRVLAVGRAFMQTCVDQDGSITGEHGVGAEKREFMPLMYEPDELAAMQELKELFDPRHLLNPGKIFPRDVSGGAGERGSGGAGEQGSGGEQPVVSPVDRSAAEPVYTPRSAGEAAEAIRAVLGAGRSIRVAGGGTKSAWLPPADAVLSTAGLNGIRKTSPDDLYVTVGAGTPLADLQAELGRAGMWVPLMSPWPAATVGGIAAAGFNAPLRMRYGGVRDLLLAATVALPDGRVIRAGRPVVKNVAGYDLPRLFVGAHGTLGLLADLTLKLAPLPRARASLLLPCETLAQGLEYGAQLLGAALVASALLLCSTRRLPIAGSAPYLLIHTAEGVPEDVAAELEEARGRLRTAGAPAAAQVDALAGSQVWADWLRAAAAERVLRAGVAAKELPALLEKAGPELAEAPFIADLASGLLYAGPQSPDALRRLALANGGYAVILSAPAAGTDPWGYRPESLALMRALKARWDPSGRFNAGAFLGL